MKVSSQAQTPTPPNSPTPTCTTTPTPGSTPTPSSTPTCTCSPHQTVTPQPDPTATAIPDEFQPKDSNGDPTGAKLEWRQYTPSPTATPASSPPWPTVLVVHEGGFYEGSMYSDNVERTATDLAAAGYYVLVVSYELAPCNVIMGQPCHADDSNSGRPPHQTDDIKALVRAARADTDHCNGKIGIVGGSAGGSHAVWVALDTTPSTGWPDWFKDGHDDRVDVAVSLSGAYDLSDRTPETDYPPGSDPQPYFQFLVNNYTGTTNLTTQKSDSVVSLVQSSTIKPLLLINTQYDTMPFHQIVDMECALQSAGVDPSLYRVDTIPDSHLHAFAYWDEYDDGYPYAQRISARVIAFLDANLK